MKVSLIHRLEYLRGHEQAWTDPYEHPEELRAMLDRLADIAIDAIDRLADCGVQGVISADDWGLQDRPMLSPKTFAEFFKPVYHRVYHHAHERAEHNRHEHLQIKCVALLRRRARGRLGIHWARR